MKYSSIFQIHFFCYFFFMFTLCVIIINGQDVINEPNPTNQNNQTAEVEIKTMTNTTENSNSTLDNLEADDSDTEEETNQNSNTTGTNFNLTLKKSKKNKSKQKNSSKSKNQSKNKTKSNQKTEIDEDYLKYYENFNLTQEIEKKYDEENPNDKTESYYQNLEKVDGEKKNKKKRKKERTQENFEKERQIRENEAREWEEKIHAFLPNNLLTSELSKGDYEMFYEEVKNIPTTIVCAFYVHDDDSKIDFEIYDPNAKMIYRIKGKNRAFYEFNATIPGVYEFHIDNSRFKNSKKVSFAIHTGETIQNKLTLEHLQPLMDRLYIAESKIKDAHFSQKMINRKYEGHYDLTQAHNKSIVTYSLIETTIMVLIFIFQFFYIRHLVNSSKA